MGKPGCRGQVRGFQVHDRQSPVMFPGSRIVWTDKMTPVTDWVPNTVLYDWAAIVAPLLATGNPAYRIATMYMEFKNVVTPGDTVSPTPTVTRGPGEGLDYYASLASSPDRDYLRVPMISALIDSTDDVNFPQGNRVSFSAQSQGTTGVFGKQFSDLANSLVYGGALVASPGGMDASQDIVLARFYYPTNQQIPKLSSGQVGLTWRWTGE